MVSDDRVAGWREQFEGLFDPHARRHAHVLDIEPDENRAGLRRQLREIYDQRPDVDGILVRIEGRDVGTATRGTADRDAGTAGEQAPGLDPGSSDGATLPGLPGEYRPVVFTCADAQCTVTLLASFYDVRRVPSCSAHGRMEVQL